MVDSSLYTVMILIFLDSKVWANSEDPDQTAPRGGPRGAV